VINANDAEAAALGKRVIPEQEPLLSGAGGAVEVTQLRSKSRSLGRGYAVAPRKLEHEKGVRALALVSSLALLLRFA
jgi:hypothetical protein